ncbi:TPA: GNAT family N-acetyltransferase [Haemophilus influenzae]
MKLFKAEQWNIDVLLPLFEAYRQAYGQAENPERTLAFLTNRMRFNESLFFIAVDENEKAIGFVHFTQSNRLVAELAQNQYSMLESEGFKLNPKERLFELSLSC